MVDNTSTATEWSLSKYLSDWPPEGTEADNAKTVGVIFLSVIALFLVCCLSADLQFCSLKLRCLKKNLGGKVSKSHRKTGKARPGRKSRRPGKAQGKACYGEVNRSDRERNWNMPDGSMANKDVTIESKDLLVTYDSPDGAPPPYYSSRYQSSVKY